MGRAPAAGPVVSFDALIAVGGDIARTTVPSPDPDGSNVETTSAAFALSGRVPVGSRWTAVAEVPLAYNRLDVPGPSAGVATDAAGVDGGYTTSDLALGNPYLGAEVRLRPDITVEGGVRLPLAPTPTLRGPTDLALRAEGAFGGLAANQEQFEAYLGRTASLTAAVRYTPQLTPALGLRLRLAPTLITSADRDRDDRSDVGLGYGAHLDARRGPLAASVGATGRQFAGSDFGGYSFFETDLAVALAASVEVGGVRPGVVARVPLTNEILSGTATVGFSLDVPVR